MLYFVTVFFNQAPEGGTSVYTRDEILQKIQKSISNYTRSKLDYLLLKNRIDSQGDRQSSKKSHLKEYLYSQETVEQILKIVGVSK